MHRFYFFLVAICLSIGISASAQYSATFVVGDDICAPITVRYGGKSYIVYGSLTVERASGSISATDCQGRKLKYSFQCRYSRGISSHDIYTFDELAWTPDTDNSSADYTSSYDSRRYDSETRIGRGIAKGIFSLGGGPSTLEAQLGISRTYGENVRLKLGYEGFLLYAGVGKDWLFNGEYKNRVLWHAGIGSYFANNVYSVSLGISAGGLAQYDKVSLMIDSDFTYWFGRWHRVGIFAGGSLGWGTFSKVFDTDDLDNNGKFAWNVEAGLVFNICGL